MKDKRVKRANARFSGLKQILEEEKQTGSNVQSGSQAPTSTTENQAANQVVQPAQEQITAQPVQEQPKAKEPEKQSLVTQAKPEPESKQVKSIDASDDVSGSDNEEKSTVPGRIDVLKADLCKEDDAISGQWTNLGIYAELYQVLKGIADDAGTSAKALTNNILYDWLINNKETIQRARKMAKKNNTLAKRFG